MQFRKYNRVTKIYTEREREHIMILISMHCAPLHCELCKRGTFVWGGRTNSACLISSRLTQWHYRARMLLLVLRMMLLVWLLLI